MAKDDCLFCQIATGQTSTPLAWEDEAAVVFADIHPKAPVHLLIVPRQHVPDLDSLEDRELAGRLVMIAREVARQEGISQAYRFHINNGRAAGQVVDHLHIHLLGQLTPAVNDQLRQSGL